MSGTTPAVIDFRSFEPYYLQLKRILLKELEADGTEGNLMPADQANCKSYPPSLTQS